MRYEEFALFVLSHALLQKDFKINMKDDDGMTALHYAAALGMTRLIRALLQAGANTNLKNNKKNPDKPLDCTMYDSTAVAAILNSVSINPERDEKALYNDVGDIRGYHLYIMEDDIVRRLPHILSAKQSREQALTQFNYALVDYMKMRRDGIEAVTKPVDKKIHQKYLFSASDKKQMLKKFDQMTGVSCVNAVMRDQAAAASLMMDAGCDYGRLIRAYANSSHPRLPALLARDNIKKFINQPGLPSGKTALHQAAEKGHAEVCEKLFAAGALLDVLDNDNNTPLMRACLRGKDQAALTLARLGAKVTQPNKQKRNIFDILDQSKQFELKKALMELLGPPVVVQQQASVGFKFIL